MSQIEVTGEKSVFETLSKVDVSEYVKEISNRKYLPWSNAWNILKSYYPLTTTETTKFLNADGTDQPYMKTDTGYYVEISVTVEDETMTEIYPVMEPQRGKGYVAITEPDAVQVNKAIKRGLVKAIAILTGLGLYLWLGEDLPVDVMPEPPPAMITDEQCEIIQAAIELESKALDKTVTDYLSKWYKESDVLKLLERKPCPIKREAANRIIANLNE